MLVNRTNQLELTQFAEIPRTENYGAYERPNDDETTRMKLRAAGIAAGGRRDSR
jgi:hypothetical protein